MSFLSPFPLFLRLHDMDMWLLSQYQIQVPEGRVSPGVLRLPVQDRDSPFTSAWRTKFNISDGNEEGHFDISTDPETNEGILNVIKVKQHRAHTAGGRGC